ncbi:restriction endonuclease subunit S [Mycoplasmopsis felis]|uniref:restriction endonuclease subunit S n=1 Tax=Mycoplasmopsis felis TaxID=33923 RepID=UPI002AF6C032|nr:restriction endonuclease subunit S [Mycoplasmopsis felis]WQQ02825.1 restriction endonuclease subunit S [Mycoplasmopsis felis]
MKKVLVPSVRFKGFNEEWSEERLEEIGQTYTGLSGKTKKDFGHGNSRYITYLNIFNNPIANLKGLDRIEKDCKQNSIKYGDIFVTTSSEIPEEVGMTSIWPFKDKENIYLNSFCFGIRLNNINNYYINFLAYNLRNNELRKDIVLLAQGISRFNISNRRFMKLNILLPNISEQQKIGKLLENIDNLITLEEIKLNKLKQLKETLLQKMFPEGNSKTPRIRFRGFYEEWKEERLENITKRMSSGGTPSTTIKKFYNGKIPFLTISDMTKVGKYINNTEKNITPEAIENSSTWLVPKNSLLLSMYASFGKTAINKKEITTSQAILGIILNNNISVEFLYYLLFLMDINKYWYKQVETGTQPNLSNWTVSKTLIKLTKNISEQQKIGDFFSKIDSLLSLYQSKLNKLRQIKEALLQKMFV